MQSLDLPWAVLHMQVQAEATSYELWYEVCTIISDRGYPLPHRHGLRYPGQALLAKASALRALFVDAVARNLAQ